jgi:hypothetical protein
MTTSGIDLKEALAQSVSLTADALTVDLADGRTITVPLAWFPRLTHGTDAERGNWRLIGGGESLLAGRRSQETSESLDRWLKIRSR